jgi:hypothetical protein
MSWLGRIAHALSSVVGKAAEGEYRPGPYYLPVTHGWLPADVGNSINWWQNGYTPLLVGTKLAIIEACISAYSQTIAMCPVTTGAVCPTEDASGSQPPRCRGCCASRTITSQFPICC